MIHIYIGIDIQIDRQVDRKDCWYMVANVPIRHFASDHVCAYVYLWVCVCVFMFVFHRYRTSKMNIDIHLLVTFDSCVVWDCWCCWWWFFDKTFLFGFSFVPPSNRFIGCLVMVATTADSQLPSESRVALEVALEWPSPGG